MLIDVKLWIKKLKNILKNNKSSKKVIYKNKLSCYNIINKEAAKTSEIVTGRGIDMANYSVYEIANWFLINKGSMEHKKLQKLCYYAQAWHYVLNEEPLIDTGFEAWVHGPVNRTLWNRLRDYGYLQVKETEFESVANNLSKDENDFLERVWATYGQFDGYQLEQLTHTEEPWIKARNGISEDQICTTPIDTALMKSYYSSKYSGDGNGE